MSRMTKPADRTRTARSSVERIWLAGLGAFALTEEQGSRFFQSLVTKGERFEKARKAELTNAWRHAKEMPADALEMVEKNVDDGMTTVLSRLGMPTKKEISLLTRRVETLADRVGSKPARSTPARPRARRATAHRAKPAASAPASAE